MSDLAERLSAERRLAILQALASAPAYRANERLLHNLLDDAGLPCSRDQVRNDLAWLHDMAMVSTREVAGVMIAEITQLGTDVSTGSASARGVARPQPQG
jgi:Fe2+ or Zn2+ uptake regulation protein